MEKGTKLKKIRKHLPMILFFAVCFLGSNVTGIERGPCASSPCGGTEVNESFISPGESIYDGFIDSVSNLIIAPSMLLLPALPLENSSPSYWIPFLDLSLDLNDSQSDAVTLQEQDIFWMPIIYIFIKLIVLLSIIWWYFLWAQMKKSKALLVIVWALVTLAMLANGIVWFTISDMGSTTLTRQYLTGQIEVIK
ncbi:MAG: hypothetical protein Q8P30_04960 [Candidatus Uhrbacteria bacterium]|nr:hypothetical protein [Candidatus Uhrbacteria bacterium]